MPALLISSPIFMIPLFIVGHIKGINKLIIPTITNVAIGTNLEPPKKAKASGNFIV